MVTPRTHETLTAVEAALEAAINGFAALKLECHNEFGVTPIYPHGLFPPSTLHERLGLIEWALDQARCSLCEGIADAGVKRCSSCYGVAK